MDGVEDASLYNVRTYAEGIYYQNSTLQGAQVYGIDQHYFNTCGYIVRTGREFLDEDYEQYRKVVILDQTAASSLFQEENPLGKTIEIDSQPYVVVGVAQQKAGFEQSLTRKRITIPISATRTAESYICPPLPGASLICTMSRRML